MHSHFFVKILFIIFALSATACSVSYSFTGASIPPEVKTIRIDYFENNAPLINPTLSQELTDQLRDKFQSQTNLIIVTEGGDMVINGQITGYNTSPTAIQSDDRAALNRLTIAVKVSFDNKYDKAQSFENQTFSRYEDYPSTTALSEVSDTYVPLVVEVLVEDIFNKTVVNW
jgi:hypothetical protein